MLRIVLMEAASRLARHCARPGHPVVFANAAHGEDMCGGRMLTVKDAKRFQERYIGIIEGGARRS